MIAVDYTARHAETVPDRMITWHGYLDHPGSTMSAWLGLHQATVAVVSPGHYALTLDWPQGRERVEFLPGTSQGQVRFLAERVLDAAQTAGRCAVA